jgi:hypothetical protein
MIYLESFERYLIVVVGSREQAHVIHNKVIRQHQSLLRKRQRLHTHYKTTQNKSRNTLSSRLSFSESSPTIVLLCLGALKHWLLFSNKWTILTVKASMFHLLCIILSETLCDKNAEAAENGHIFKLVSVFQCSLTHRVACAANQAVIIKAAF